MEPKSLLAEHLENGEAPRFPAEESKEQDLLIETQGEPESGQLCRVSATMLSGGEAAGT